MSRPRRDSGCPFTLGAPFPPTGNHYKEYAKSMLVERVRKPLRTRSLLLNVVVQRKLEGMRPQPHRIHFLRTLVLNVSAQQFLRKHIALEQEAVIFL